MSEARNMRAYDAAFARAAILNAAEEVFASHGFDGARMEMIASASGYTKSLIFHYFGDKLGLYVAILQRIREQAEIVQAQTFAPFFTDEAVGRDAENFAALIETGIRTAFDSLLAHPHLLRLFAWEAASRWQTLTQILARRESQGKEYEQIRLWFCQAQEAGIMRSDLDPHVVLTLLLSLCQHSLTALPLYQHIFPGEDWSSPEALVHTREQLVRLMVHAILVDSSQEGT
ncbi:TetR/AcrR family transcriptional regulator [Ktedonosporobacter rubrisoli]|uniref:TetR/AcrR family transcriptional regulator n=1 Tax=Ktedonosporobacter rubrisoli TaxID=2509675 RepID=A0A4P6K5E6_KTERU|nr:TetR/AcrR family transcriptional regulator [Ktedonosporobacter rubrisoli]QBD83315.1 TetR/AcrR family transcriptional regulator [Ktedonosporobacter rubrisoli]